MVFFSVINQERVGDFIDQRMLTSLPGRDSIEVLHQESLDKMIDLLENFENAAVRTASPSGSVQRGKFAKVFIQFQEDMGSRRFLYRQ